MAKPIAGKRYRFFHTFSMAGRGAVMISDPPKRLLSRRSAAKTDWTRTLGDGILHPDWDFVLRIQQNYSINRTYISE